MSFVIKCLCLFLNYVPNLTTQLNKSLSHSFWFFWKDLFQEENSIIFVLYVDSFSICTPCINNTQWQGNFIPISVFLKMSIRIQNVKLVTKWTCFKIIYNSSIPLIPFLWLWLLVGVVIMGHFGHFVGSKITLKDRLTNNFIIFLN